jgi:hypothetical protein
MRRGSDVAPDIAKVLKNDCTIRWWWSCCACGGMAYSLSLRNLEEMMAERPAISVADTHDRGCNCLRCNHQVA